MKSFVDSVVIYLNTHRKEMLVFLLFFSIASASVLYSLTLPLKVHGDTYVTLLANKVAADPTFPDRELLLNLDYKPYLYTNILAFFVQHFSLFTYKLILLFFVVLATLYASYFALRILGFSRRISIMTAIVALIPRVYVAGGVFGVITGDDVMGASLGIPFLWLLSAWFLKRKFDKKVLWPVFLFSGLACYVHPVSLVLFNGLMFIMMAYWWISEKNYIQGGKDFIFSVIAFCFSASFLLVKILFVTKKIGVVNDWGGIVATGKEYSEALLYRVGWDIVPGSLLYLLHFVVINFVFFIAFGYVYYCIRKKIIQKGTQQYFIAQSSFLIIGLSIFLSFFLPNTEIWLVKNYNFPYILQQSSRFFVYYYLGAYFIWATAVSLFIERYKKNSKLFFALFFIIGVLSSTFFFEIFKFTIGYKNHKKEYIPIYLEPAKIDDETKIFPPICEGIRQAGVKKEDLVISDDFQLRYYCETKLFTTFEEGSIYFMFGKNELVWWFRNYKEQTNIIYHGTPDQLVSFAKRIGAKYALIDKKSDLAKALVDSKMIVFSTNGNTLIERVLIKINP